MLLSKPVTLKLQTSRRNFLDKPRWFACPRKSHKIGINHWKSAVINEPACSTRGHISAILNDYGAWGFPFWVESRRPGPAASSSWGSFQSKYSPGKSVRPPLIMSQRQGRRQRGPLNLWSPPINTTHSPKAPPYPVQIANSWPADPCKSLHHFEAA